MSEPQDDFTSVILRAVEDGVRDGVSVEDTIETVRALIPYFADFNISLQKLDRFVRDLYADEKRLWSLATAYQF